MVHVDQFNFSGFLFSCVACCFRVLVWFEFGAESDRSAKYPKKYE